MRSALLIICIHLCLRVFTQHAVLVSYDRTNFLSRLSEVNDEFRLQEAERTGLLTYNTFTQPSPPILTTNAAELEICDGKSARLTASSPYTIYWYTTPPPLGSPVGTGTSYITPELSTGYYTYYAIADNNGIKSDISAMEVIMVFPNPTLSISSNIINLCASSSATLKASGATYLEWENGVLAQELRVSPDHTRTYTVTGINTAGCKSTAVYTQLVEDCRHNDELSLEAMTMARNGLAHAGEEKQFSVFPNPNKGEFNVRAGIISESTTVEVYNWLGALVHYSRITSETSSVDIRNYASGIYIVRLIENDKILKQQKIVKE